MERTVALLQRLYWAILAAIVVLFSLINLDLLRSVVKVDLLFGKFAVQAVWFLAFVLVAFLLQILISRSLLALVRAKLEKLNRELAALRTPPSGEEERRG
ncbi:MAG: hypothetical protein NUW06_04445 [Candidatus Acetothermia bacterium]|nr:hypothetical protein [Candidatus Acetothermia bacterium]MDH7505291.1 hypothetical protein [Candidatus Acetothermia bacterium]